MEAPAPGGDQAGPEPGPGPRPGPAGGGGEVPSGGPAGVVHQRHDVRRQRPQACGRRVHPEGEPRARLPYVCYRDHVVISKHPTTIVSLFLSCISHLFDLIGTTY